MAEQQSVDGQEAVIPLAHPFASRDGTLQKDSCLINCVVERGEEGLQVRKRPGLGTVRQLAAGLGQGLFRIGTVGYAVLGDSYYNVSTGAGIAFPTPGSAGQLYDSFPDNAGGPTLVKNAQKLWTVTAGAATLVTDADYPAATLPGICELDGTYYVMDAADGTIHGSGLQDATSWDALNFIGPNKSLGKGMAVARHLNYIVGFYESGVQMFFDAANATGSPLAPVDNASWLTGCALGRSVAHIGDLTLFLAKSQSNGRSVEMLSGLQMVTVSDPYVERVLNKDSLVGANALGMKVGGHSLYCLNLPASGLSLVYDLVYQMWYVWQTGGSGFAASSFLDANGQCLLQHPSNGAVYEINPSYKQDAGASLPVTIVTPPKSWGSLRRKFIPSLYLLGDTLPSTLAVSYTDDDYTTFSTPRTLSLSSERKALHRCGSSRKRAWKLVHDDVTDFRAVAIVVEVEAGPG